MPDISTTVVTTDKPGNASSGPASRNALRDSEPARSFRQDYDEIRQASNGNQAANDGQEPDAGGGRSLPPQDDSAATPRQTHAVPRQGDSTAAQTGITGENPVLLPDADSSLLPYPAFELEADELIPQAGAGLHVTLPATSAETATTPLSSASATATAARDITKSAQNMPIELAGDLPAAADDAADGNMVVKAGKHINNEAVLTVAQRAGNQQAATQTQAAFETGVLEQARGADMQTGADGGAGNASGRQSQLDIAALVQAAGGQSARPAGDNPLTFNTLLNGVASQGQAPVSGTMQAPVMQPAISEAFGSTNWSQGLGRQVLMMVNQNIQSAEIRMNPAHLGPVEVRIDMEDEQVSVAFSSRHAVVREAMEAAMPRLREMLDANGFTLADADVSRHGFEEQQGDDYDRAGGGSASLAGAATQADTGTADDSLAGLPGPMLTSMVDVYI